MTCIEIDNKYFDTFFQILKQRVIFFLVTLISVSSHSFLFIFQVLENILKFSGIPENIENVNSENVEKKYDLLNSRYGHELIGILAEHCRDPSLMVRKQVI